MYINNDQIGNDQSDIKIFNLTTSPILGINVYISSDVSDSYSYLVDPSNNNSKLSLFIDDIKYDILYGQKGESSINPISYKRDIDSCKLKITKNNAVIGLVVGSDNSKYGENWYRGLNISKDDFISLKINLDIQDPDLKDYILTHLRIVVSPITINVYYDKEVITQNIDYDSLGWGMGAFGSSGTYGGLIGE